VSVAEVLLATAPAGLIGGYLVGRYLSGSRGGMQAALSVTSFLSGALFAVAFATRDLTVAKTMAVLAIIAFGSTAGTLTTLLVETVPPALRSVACQIARNTDPLSSSWGWLPKKAAYAAFFRPTW
jgi:hypothetical protein